MSRWQKRMMVFLVFVLGVTLCGCGNKELVPLERMHLFGLRNMATVRAEFCTMDANQITADLKFIFVIDKSGSNIGTAGEPGTDPNGYRRYTPLLTFLNSAVDDPTVYYSLVNLSTNATTVSNNTNDRLDFITTIEEEHNPGGNDPPQPADGGWTNYLAALTEVRRIIERDIQNAKDAPVVKTSHYVIMFVSDGAPYIAQDTLQETQDVLDAITSVKSFEVTENEWVGSIQVHTGYYTNTVDPDARVLMQQMALTGNGEYYEFASGAVIDFNQFSVPDRSVKHLLSDVLVSNTNQLWESGELALDSDGDGLGDIKEEELGSDPFDADSDDNGVSDGVEFFMTQSPCKARNCSPGGAEPYTFCNRFVRPEYPDGPKFTDQDGDGLNDCEEEDILGSRKANFDSNEDWVPDRLAFRRKMAFIEGFMDTWLDSDWDTVLNYTEVKINTPVTFPNDKILGLKAYDYKLETVSQDEIRDCYRLVVKDVVILGEVNQIGIYILENTSIVDNERYMRYAEKPVRGQETVDFVNSDF